MHKGYRDGTEPEEILKKYETTKTSQTNTLTGGPGSGTKSGVTVPSPKKEGDRNLLLEITNNELNTLKDQLANAMAEINELNDKLGQAREESSWLYAIYVTPFLSL